MPVQLSIEKDFQKQQLKFVNDVQFAPVVAYSSHVVNRKSSFVACSYSFIVAAIAS